MKSLSGVIGASAAEDQSGNWDSVAYRTGPIDVVETRSHGANHEVTGIQASSPGSPGVMLSSVYDANGNLLVHDGMDLTWDFQNRLAAVHDNATGELVARYTFDAFDRRVSKTVEGSGELDGYTQFVYDGPNVIEERDAWGAWQRLYVFGDGMDTPIIMELPGTGLNDTIAGWIRQAMVGRGCR